jgi:uncharacterized protein YcfL
MKDITFFTAIAIIALLLCSCASSDRRVIATRHTTLTQQSIVAEDPVPTPDAER